MLGTALAVAALAVACDDPGTDLTPSPAPTPTTAPSAAHTPTSAPVIVQPSRAPTSTSSSLTPKPTALPSQGLTPTPATILAPTPGPQLTDTPTLTAVHTPTVTATPEPTLQERIEGLFSDYRDNAPFDDHLRKLSDYQSPTPEAISSFETLAAHARQEFELTKRAVIAAGFLGLDSSEANLAIDAYLKHQRKYGLQDPTGFASVTDLILFQHHLNTPGTIGLPDGSEEDRRRYILSSEERTETLIAGADIWSWVALPEQDLETIPDWVKESYPPDDVLRESDVQTVFAGPFSLNGSSDIRFNASPWYTDDAKLSQATGLYNKGDFETYMALTPHRQQWLANLAMIANSTADDLDALAMGNLDRTVMYYSFGARYEDTALEKLDFLVGYKSGIVSNLDIRSRGFVDNTGDLNLGLTATRFDKSILLQATDIRDAGAFRLPFAENSEDPYAQLLDFTFPYPNNEHIVLYVTGQEFRVIVVEPNQFYAPEGLQRYDLESFGILYVLPEARDHSGNRFTANQYSVWEDGRLGSFGEPELVPLIPIKFPFFDREKTVENWLDRYGREFGHKNYGVAFVYHPAMLDEGRKKDPLYANDPAAQNRGPWIKVFDNRADAP